MQINAVIATIIHQSAILTINNSSGGIRTGFPKFDEAIRGTETALWISKDQSEEEIVAHDAAAQRCLQKEANKMHIFVVKCEVWTDFWFFLT